MTYSQEQIDYAIRVTRFRFYRSAGIAVLLGAISLYAISSGADGDDSISRYLFAGFIIGFAVAGIILPQGFRAQLYKSKSQA